MTAIRTLTALARLRRIETDQARRGLAETLAEESALAARDGAIAREVAGTRQMTGDFDRDGFAAWLARMASRRRQLADELAAAAVRTQDARGALAGQRMAETAAAEVLARALAERTAETARRDQTMLEDAARALKRSGPTRSSPGA